MAMMNEEYFVAASHFCGLQSRMHCTIGAFGRDHGDDAIAVQGQEGTSMNVL